MNWAHFHLVVNHVLVVGAMLVFVLLAVAYYRESNELKEIGLWACVMLGAMAYPIRYTGDLAADIIHKLPDAAHAAIATHEAAANQATGGLLLLGLCSALALSLRKRNSVLAAPLGYGVLVLSILGALLVVKTADLGGQIRHPETRPEFQLPQ